MIMDEREYGVVRKACLYVWVFWCPGVNELFYRGWWLYLIGRAISYGKYLERDEQIISNLMGLFPLGQRNLEEWKAEFVKKYQRGYYCGKPQGKSPIWAEIEGGTVRKLLARAQWPTRRWKEANIKADGTARKQKKSGKSAATTAPAGTDNAIRK